MTEDTTPNTATPNTAAPASSPRARYNWKLGVAAAAILLAGAGIGATALSLARPSDRVQFDTALETTQISALTETDAVELQGKAVEIYGNKFIIQDSSGRALVDTGRLGEDGDLVTRDEVLTVQGRFDNGFLRATGLQRADGTVVELRAGPPPHKHAHREDGPGKDGPRHGPHRGPDAGPMPLDRDAPPPPPPGGEVPPPPPPQ